MIKSIVKSILRKSNPFSTDFEKKLYKKLRIRPNKIFVYQIAFQHASYKKKLEDNNERLEFLGDAILDSIMAEYLYKKYPFKDEGFLTEMKSKIVNRQVLNNIAKKMQLETFLQTNVSVKSYNPHVLGNTLEALIGAIYLDKGFSKTHKWVMQQMILPHIFLDKVEAMEANIKNKLFQWANKNNKSIEFRLIETNKNSRQQNIFNVGIFIDEDLLVNATGLKKKEAEQNASLLAFEKLHLK